MHVHVRDVVSALSIYLYMFIYLFLSFFSTIYFSLFLLLVFCSASLLTFPVISNFISAFSSYIPRRSSSPSHAQSASNRVRAQVRLGAHVRVAGQEREGESGLYETHG